MVIIYVYKLVDGKIDVFEADTQLAARKSDGSFCPSRASREIITKFNKCLINGSGKGITQYNKRCTWVICKPATVFRNMLWLEEFNLEKAIKIFKKYNNDKVVEYNKLILELEESNKKLEDCISLCNHKFPDGSLALIVKSHKDDYDERYTCQCKICGKKFSEFQANILNNEKYGSLY